MFNSELIPPEAVGLKLYRIDQKERLHACESVSFVKGRAAVLTVLRRAEICGRVDPGGKIGNHFADVLDCAEDLIETVALDGDSYRALKVRELRCRVESSDA